MEKDAEKHCKTCYGCQLVSRPSPPEPIRSTALPTEPWRDLAIDLLEPLPTGESILVVVDQTSQSKAKWPQANREVERQNSSLLKRLQIAHAEKKDWKKELNVYLTAYRSLPNLMSGVSLTELLFGRKIRTRLPELSDVHVEQEVRDRDNE